MKQLFFIALLAVTASGCATVKKKIVGNQEPTIGMTEAEFKQVLPRAGLVYLTSDSSGYKNYRMSTDNLWIDDFYFFSKGKLAKFEQKTHFFNTGTLKIDKTKTNN